MRPSLESVSSQLSDLATSPAADSAAGAETAAEGGEPAAAAEPPSPTIEPLRTVDYAAKGYHLDVCVKPEDVVAAAEVMDRNGFGLDAVTGVDWIAEESMELVYDYFHPLCDLRVVIRSRIPRASPEIPTISRVFPGANWHERETHDFFGIRFTGHPDLTPLLLPEDADYHPLRKDYAP